MKNIIIIFLSLFVMNTTNASLNEIFGNQPDGDSCSSDYQCESLCCNVNSCKPHNPSEGKFCNKPSDQQCITNEFCAGAYVNECKLYKLGTPNPGGIQACAMRCPAVFKRGDCKNNYCESPRIPPIPSWDGVDCTNAIDP